MQLLQYFQETQHNKINSHRSHAALTHLSILCEGLWRLIVASIPFGRLIGDLIHDNPIRCNARTALKYTPVLGFIEDNGLWGKTNSAKRFARVERKLKRHVELNEQQRKRRRTTR